MDTTIISLDPAPDCAFLFAEGLRKLGGKPGNKILQLTPGKYLFRKGKAAESYLPVSNTVTRDDCQIKHIGIFADGLENLTIAGNGAELVFDGDMSAIVLRRCRHIRLENLIVDYLHPRVSEMSVRACGKLSAEFVIHSSSRWTADENGRFCWVNADGITETLTSAQAVQVAPPGNTSNLRTLFNPVRNALSFTPLADGAVRFYYGEPHPLKPGETWQFRDTSRRENGIVIANCQDVELDGMQLGFTPGLGVVAQMTRDISIFNHRHAPLPGGGRVCAALADCIQISSCYGKVEISESFFSGTQDDPVNIHGTYLGLKAISGRKVWLTFCQPETWGWLPFQIGDEVCPVKRSNFQRGRSYRVEAAELLDEWTVQLTLHEEISDIDDPEKYVMENMSAYPDVSVHDCLFECYPTRGILLTSAGKCRIYNNEFRQTAARPAILISADASNWYESGGVRDVEITGNRFRFCSVPVIDIDPNIKEDDGSAVHANIKIKDNIFEKCTSFYLRHHSAKDLYSDLPENKISLADISEIKH